MRSVTSEPRRRGALVAALALCAALLVPEAAHAEVLRLGELEARALTARASLAAGQARSAAAAARIDLAGAARRPQLGATVQADAGPGSRLVRVVDETGTPYLVAGSREIDSAGALTPVVNYGASLALSSRLYDFGRTELAVRAAEAEHSAVKASAAADRAGVIGEVRGAYLAWLSACGTRDLLRQSAAAATALRQALEGRVAEGVRPAADLSAARYEETRAALDLARSDAAAHSAALALAQAVGGELPPGADPDYALLDWRGAPDAAAPAEPEVDLLERRRDAAFASSRAEARSHAPVLAASAEAGVRGQASHVFPAYRVGVSLTVPILDGGAASASSAIARAQANELSALAREARERASRERAGARVELGAIETRLRFAEQLAALAAEGQRQAEERRELASGTVEAVIEARLKSVQARLEVLNARVSRAEAALKLGGPPAPGALAPARAD